MLNAAGSALLATALNVVMTLEAITGMPIAILERTGDDPRAFWARTTEILCEKTGAVFCEEDVRFMVANTNPLGFTRLLAYEGPDGNQHIVCAVLPAEPNLSPSFAATGISSGGLFNWDALPNKEQMQAWLLMMHAARCLDRDADAFDEKRADAFASLALTLIEGDPRFTAGQEITPARFFAAMRNTSSTTWAVNVGERILLDVWKQEAATILQQAYGCQVTLVPSTELDVPNIPRDLRFEAHRCSAMEHNFQSLHLGFSNPDFPNVYNGYGGPGGTQQWMEDGFQGVVTDSNLHLWMYGENPHYAYYFWNDYQVDPAPVLGAPPLPWHPLKPFPSFEAGVSYIWTTADAIASQS